MTARLLTAAAEFGTMLAGWFTIFLWAWCAEILLRLP